MKRREFINWAGLGLIASYLPVALVACGESESTTNAASDTKDLFSVGTISQLETTGFLLDEEAKVLVVRDSEGKLMAVNPTCTHQGCIVDWESKENQFICPCHYAKFAPDGEVLAKPAPSSLSSYEVTDNNGEVLVKLV